MKIYWIVILCSCLLIGACCNKQKHYEKKFPDNALAMFPKYAAGYTLNYKDKQGNIETLVSEGIVKLIGEKECVQYCSPDDCYRITATPENAYWTGNFTTNDYLKNIAVNVKIFNSPNQCVNSRIYFCIDPKDNLRCDIINNYDICADPNITNVLENPIDNFKSRGGMVYPRVYALDFTYNIKIDSIYYAPSYGVVRMVLLNGNTLDLINP